MFTEDWWWKRSESQKVDYRESRSQASGSEDSWEREQRHSKEQRTYWSSGNGLSELRGEVVRWQAGTERQESKTPPEAAQALCLSGGVSVLHCDFATSEDTEIRTQRHSWKQLRKQELGLWGMWWEYKGCVILVLRTMVCLLTEHQVGCWLSLLETEE